MSEDEIAALRHVLADTYKFEQGYIYLICYNKNAVARLMMLDLGTYLTSKGVSAAIVSTEGEPFPANIGLYRLQQPNKEETP